MAKDKEVTKLTYAGVNLIEQVAGILEVEPLNLYLIDDEEKLQIKVSLSKKPPLILNYSQITAVELLSEKQIVEKDKSVIGRAAAGALILGPLAGVIGGISGVGSKKKVKYDFILLINYKSSQDGEIKAISFTYNPMHKKDVTNFVIALQKRAGIFIDKKDISEISL